MFAAIRRLGRRAARAAPPLASGDLDAPRTVHLVEPVGRGGIFQHSVAMANALHAAGVAVLLHTASDHEDVGSIAAPVCRCTRPFRHERWRVVRCVRVGIRQSLFLAAHLLRNPPAVVHLQGAFALPATLLAASLLRVRGVPLVFSPHDAFPRRGTMTGRRTLQATARLAACSIVYNHHDVHVLRRWGAREVVVSPLLPLVPAVSGDKVHRWRRRWQEDGAQPVVVLLAGHLRTDKRLDLALSAMRHLGPLFRLAVVGEDSTGRAAELLTGAATPLPVVWTPGFLPLDDFVAAVAAADVVICPHDMGSQSGVLAIAAAVGTVTVARDVGGLTEQADFLVGRDDPRDLARKILAASDTQSRASRTGGGISSPLASHLRAYRHAVSGGARARVRTGLGVSAE